MGGIWESERLGKLVMVLTPSWDEDAESSSNPNMVAS